MEPTSPDDLARRYMPLVDRLTAVMCRRFGPHVEADDVRSFALMGLAKAIKGFDPSRGTSFAAYAEPKIRGAIYDGVAEASWFPRRLMRRIMFYRRADEMLSHASTAPRPGDTVEAAHRLADTLKELATAYVTTYVAESGCEPAEVASPAIADEEVDRRRFSRNLSAYVSTLPEREGEVVRLYFWENMTLTDIGARFGYHKSWASRVLSTGLDRLRRLFEEQAATGTGGMPVPYDRRS